MQTCLHGGLGGWGADRRRDHGGVGAAIIDRCIKGIAKLSSTQPTDSPQTPSDTGPRRHCAEWWDIAALGSDSAWGRKWRPAVGQLPAGRQRHHAPACCTCGSRAHGRMKSPLRGHAAGCRSSIRRGSRTHTTGKASHAHPSLHLLEIRPAGQPGVCRVPCRPASRNRRSRVGTSSTDRPGAPRPAPPDTEGSTAADRRAPRPRDRDARACAQWRVTAGNVRFGR